MRDYNPYADMKSSNNSVVRWHLFKKNNEYIIFNNQFSIKEYLFYNLIPIFFVIDIFGKSPTKLRILTFLSFAIVGTILPPIYFVYALFVFWVGRKEAISSRLIKSQDYEYISYSNKKTKKDAKAEWNEKGILSK